MGEYLVHHAYFNIKSLVGAIHSQIYKGSNDRNRYQLNENLFVWWQNGMIVKIIDLQKKQTADFDVTNMVLTNNDGQLKSRGFYVNIKNELYQKLPQVYSADLLVFYKSKGDLLNSIQKDVDIIFQYLNQKGNSKC